MTQPETPYPGQPDGRADADGPGDSTPEQATVGQSAPEQAAPEQAAPEQAAPDQATVDLAHQLFDLARQGRTEQLAAYVDAGAPANLTDPSGNTLLMLAAYHGHAGLVRELARRGADVDRLNDRGQSPLAGAVFKGEQEVIDALLDHGADPDTGTPTARESAQLFGRPDLFGGPAAP